MTTHHNLIGSALHASELIDDLADALYQAYTDQFQLLYFREFDHTAHAATQPVRTQDKPTGKTRHALTS